MGGPQGWGLVLRVPNPFLSPLLPAICPDWMLLMATWTIRTTVVSAERNWDHNSHSPHPPSSIMPAYTHIHVGLMVLSG